MSGRVQLRRMLPDLTRAAWRTVVPFVLGASPASLMAVEQSSGSLLWGAYASLTSTVKQLARNNGIHEPADEDDDFIWDDQDDIPDESTASTDSRASCVTEEIQELGPVATPQMLALGNYTPKCSEQSGILRNADMTALAAAVPMRHKWRDWSLLYSSSRYALPLC